MSRPKHFAPNTVAGIQRINREQAAYDRNPEAYERRQRQREERRERERHERMMQEQIEHERMMEQKRIEESQQNKESS